VALGNGRGLWFEFPALGFGKDFATMMVVSMSGNQAPGIMRSPMILRTCKLHQAGSVSVRGLAGASRMERLSRRFSSDLGELFLLLVYCRLRWDATSSAENSSCD